MELSRLYLITDGTQTLGRPLADVVKAALEGGIEVVQLREKESSGKELFNIAGELRELTKQYNAKFIINDRVDIALAVSADGVHLRINSIPIADVRLAFKKVGLTAPVIGVSTHSSGEVLRAESDGADFITFGPVYFTPSKASYGEPLGIDKLKKVAKSISIPIYALGGIKKHNVSEVLSAGAHGVAMISAIMTADDVKREARDIAGIITSHQPPVTSYLL